MSMKIIINALLAAMIVAPSPPVPTPKHRTKPEYTVSARTKRRLIAGGKWVWA